MSEIDQIKLRYKNRKDTSQGDVYSKYFEYTQLSRCERELKASLLLQKHCGPLGEKKILEVGAGHGDNIHFLMRAGLQWKNIYVNELLEDRLKHLKSWFSEKRIIPGDFIKSSVEEEAFDIVYQSTVFSSILDSRVQQDLLDKMTRSLKTGGYFLWYDFTFDNPKNPDVKGVKFSQIKNLCKDYRIVEKRRVTLAPPIGRRVGGWYPLFNTCFPFLRTHIICLMQKL